MGAEVIEAPPAEQRRRAARAPLPADRGPRPAGDGPHGVGPGRDGPLPPGRQRLDARDQAAARGRRRAAAARRLARRDRGVLPRRTACRAASTRPTRDTKRGLIRDEILPLLRRLHPGADANLLALAGRAAAAAARARALARRAPRRRGRARRRPTSAAGVRAVREYDTLRLEGEVQLGAVAALDRASRGSRCARGARAIGSRDGARRCRICSWTRRCRASQRDDWPIVVRGDEVVAVPGIADAPGWEGTVRAHGGTSDHASRPRTSARS